jgi:hypothetical protein
MHVLNIYNTGGDVEMLVTYRPKYVVEFIRMNLQRFNFIDLNATDPKSSVL